MSDYATTSKKIPVKDSRDTWIFRDGRQIAAVGNGDVQ
jgi:hypothetical protein